LVVEDEPLMTDADARGPRLDATPDRIGKVADLIAMPRDLSAPSHHSLVECARRTRSSCGRLSRTLCDPGGDVVAPQDELGLGQMREDLVREVAAVPLGEDRIVRCVEEQGACKFASAYPRSAPCV
jgi:hypothetical protein